MDEMLNIDGAAVPVTRAGVIVVGAGAAGMCAAVKLVEFLRDRGSRAPHEQVLVVTGGLPLGASRMSGSDKQTYYKMGTSPHVPDTAADFASTLTAFGCCHGDNALIEGIGSLRGFYHLVEAGVPFPHDSLGAFIGYKTDHDPYERATSAGPKTSKFMSECLQAKAVRLGVRIVDKCPVVRFVASGQGQQRRIVAMLCLDGSRSAGGGGQPPLRAFVANCWVLAAGGPGEIYRDTVYPRGQIGIHAPALEAGLVACNLTESQFGLASTKFRWNVSGTYMQVAPRIFSTDAAGGDARDFLTEYFDDMPSMATNIFLKGYQWPFDAQRIADHQSSLIDMAVHVETAIRGRRVWMDFLRNPAGKPSWQPFALEGLKPEALDYLRKTGAMQATPIERLAHMNQPAIDIYADNGIDLRREPLEIAICAQHNNGGFAVNKWWESNIPRTFVIGEMAGTHGVKRPGGSALNAGQVGAMRAAEYIANVYCPADGQSPPPVPGELGAAVAEALAELRAMLSASAAPRPQQVLDELRERMTRFGAHLRWLDGASAALTAAVQQCRRLAADGIAAGSLDELPQAVAARQQCLAHVAFLKAIVELLRQGAGSRGSHCVLGDDGRQMHPALVDPVLGPLKVKAENLALRQSILHVRYSPACPELFETFTQPPRPVPRLDVAFEPAWKQYRDGDIFRR
jgi:succinate dehydrogenase/fumarate reductase flavoprotein subunit